MLFSKVYGSALRPPLVVLHGLFGSSDNWHAHAVALSDHFQVHTVDLRNHGASFHHSVHTYEAMAADVDHFLQEKNLQAVRLLGHSMGGKVAMHVALRYPERLAKLLIVDIAPRAYSFAWQQDIITALRGLSLATLPSRRAADEQMAGAVPDGVVRQFLLKNLVRGAQGFTWKINLTALEAHLPALAEAVSCATPCSLPACFLRGERSSYVRPEDFADISRIFPRAVVRVLPKAGHWAHADAPDAFRKEVVGFFGTQPEDAPRGIF